MFPRLLLLFVGLPLVELAILIKLGEAIGLWPTIGLIIVTGVIGASMARYQGFMVYRRIQAELAAGKMPASQLIDGLLILIGGIVLLTPGLLTDLFGFSLLIPWVRSFLKSWLSKKFSGMIQSGQSGFFYSDSSWREN